MLDVHERRISAPVEDVAFHDAVLEDLLDRAEAAVGAGPATQASWSPWVRVLRLLERAPARRPIVRETAVPPGPAAVGALPHADVADAFVVDLPPGLRPGIAACHAALAGAATPAWLSALVRVRTWLARALRLRTARWQPGSPPVPLLAQGPDHVVTGADDHHLDVRAVVGVQEASDGAAVLRGAVRVLADDGPVTPRRRAGSDGSTTVGCGGSVYDAGALAQAPPVSSLPVGPAGAVDDLGDPAFDPALAWSVVHQDDDRVDLVRELETPVDNGGGDVRTHESVSLERITGASNVPEGTWLLTSAGPCVQRLVVDDGLGDADVTLASPPAREATSLGLLVRERACASGRDAVGRTEVRLEETADQVRLRVGVRPGGRPGLPEQPGHTAHRGARPTAR